VRSGIEAASKPAPLRLDALNALDRSRGPSLWLLPDQYWDVYQMGGVAATDALVSARIRVLQAAVAIERHRRAHGELPEKLEEIGRWGAMKAPPLDPFTGEHLRWRPAPGGGGWTIYSVGMNRRDDQGKTGEQQSQDTGFRFLRPGGTPAPGD
jgi:hypothetical protein